MNFELIENIRKRKGYTQKDLAEMLNITVTGYQKMIKNGDIKVSMLERLCSVFSVQITTFFGATESMVNEPTAHYGTGDCEKELLQALKELNQVRKDKENLMSELLSYKK